MLAIYTYIYILYIRTLCIDIDVYVYTKIARHDKETTGVLVSCL